MPAPTKTGYADVLIGLQYGDEGKARVVDLLAADYDIVARFNGGVNAGHTIATANGEVRLRQVPSGVLHAHVALYIGSGCVVSLEQLAKEIGMLASLGIDLSGRFSISDRCPVVQPVHIAQDHLHGREIGTTGNGIGPCYADLAARVRDGGRCAFQLRDLASDPAGVIAQMHGAAPWSDHAERSASAKRMHAAWEVVRGFVRDNPLWLTNRVERGARVLFEGAQSVMLDVLHGQQPWVTSSHTLPSYAYVGGDLPCKYHRKTVGVAKAIVSRVGDGPLPGEFGGKRSELYCAGAAREGLTRDEEAAGIDVRALLAGDDEFDLGVALRISSNEYGTGTGRPRRIGRLDLAQLRVTVKQAGVDEIYLNKCDSLAAFSFSRGGTIPLIVGAGGEGDTGCLRLPAFDAVAIPQGADAPVPPELLAFLAMVEDAIGVPLRGAGLGPRRDQMLMMKQPDKD
ncbi:adenylosuccinate synthetase [Cupriavidus numazuensis]|uniref:Adenylosuccinate synthetase n=1 Tax=Cupriavidus numazuensis TaxID=221992 RepID=A0ABM8TRL3_9BURK|nr:adenylosuccinate synthetase [Cupriavidus numazuensis]CAG2158871.1 Adenylosuccinate synthetase [Cupriavidus numazuensis]